jgi:hypothetical protein
MREATCVSISRVGRAASGAALGERPIIGTVARGGVLEFGPFFLPRPTTTFTKRRL